MTAHVPARTLMERADELNGYADLWLRPRATSGAENAGKAELPSRAQAVTLDLARLAAAGFVRPGALPSALAEEVRLAKRALLPHGAALDDRARRLLVCSASPGDGKTFCAVNLAFSLAAERELEVLLVDGDVAKPSIPGVLGVPPGPGLLDAIADEGSEPASFVLETDIPHLKILRAGVPVPDATELLASERAATVLDALTAGHPRRLLVIDSPPVLAASPATALALHAGQAILVVRADRTTEGELREAHALLGRVPAVHLLLNGVTAPSGRSRYGSYYGTER